MILVLCVKLAKVNEIISIFQYFNSFSNAIWKNIRICCCDLIILLTYNNKIYYLLF